MTVQELIERGQRLRGADPALATSFFAEAGVLLLKELTAGQQYVISTDDYAAAEEEGTIVRRLEKLWAEGDYRTPEEKRAEIFDP